MGPKSREEVMQNLGVRFYTCHGVFLTLRSVEGFVPEESAFVEEWLHNLQQRSGVWVTVRRSAHQPLQKRIRCGSTEGRMDRV